MESIIESLEWKLRWASPAPYNPLISFEFLFENGKFNEINELLAWLGPSVCRNDQIVKEMSNLRMKHEARRKNRLAIACFLCGLLAGRSPRQLALKEDERPAPTHSLSSTAQQLTLLWLWLGKPTKEMSCAVGLIESGGWLVVFIVSGLRAAAAAIAPLTRKTSNNPINP